MGLLQAGVVEPGILQQAVVGLHLFGELRQEGADVGPPGGAAGGAGGVDADQLAGFVQQWAAGAAGAELGVAALVDAVAVLAVLQVGVEVGECLPLGVAEGAAAWGLAVAGEA